MEDKHDKLNTRSAELFHTFWKMNANIRKIVQKTATDNGLTVPQYALLVAIAPRKKMTQKELGKVIRFPKSTLSQAVDGLSQAGLFDRHPVEDNRREMQLILTEKGMDLYECIKNQEGSMNQVFQTAVKSLPQGKYDALIEGLQQISEYIANELEPKGESQG